MLNISFPRSIDRLLFLGAHSDDIEIGCGGTILRLIKENENLTVDWVVLSSDKGRAREASQSADLFLDGVREKRIQILDFRETYFPYVGSEIKEWIQALSTQISPDIIFTHYRDDLHQDHRLVSELTWNAFRDHLILEYEIPKYDGDIGLPNVYVHLEDEVVHQKTKIIADVFRSQAVKPWFGEDVFLSVLRIRGIESNAPERYAEAFYGRKLVY